MGDWPELYSDDVAAVLALVEELTPAQLEMVVPATPGWTVRQVLAHLAGGAADHVAGRTDGAPGPGWTGRHVAERAGHPVEDLVRELRSHEDGVRDLVADPSRQGIVWDVAVHHADLHEALGLGATDPRSWQPVLAAVRPAGDWSAVGEYELFRGRFSRRSQAQLAAWPVPAEQIDELGVFGPREDDQPIP